ncbi:MAG: hypothetical protein H7210_07165 [Pyrinomonadaceae bacterium]|nr:hypothetical protein [Phycisphaerales bacterium]
MKFVTIRALGVGVLMAGAMLASSAQAAVIYTESAQGDLSNDRLNPTSFNLAAGENQLLGVFTGEDGMGGYDIDYYSITIPAGMFLQQIVHQEFISTDSAGFMAIEQGPVFSTAPADATPGNLMGWVIFGHVTVGSDIFPTLASNGIGFARPLPGGTYTFWAQQTGALTDYTLTFVVVPSPMGATMLSCGALMAFGRRRR